MNKSTIIQDIARRLKNGTMSFVIGAGFSKNISNKFLSWKELLHDMIMEMYEEDRQRWHATDDDLIGKYGYLGIASDYVRRKGYHEAIDHYIEKRTPVLERGDNGKMRLAEDGYVISDEVDVTTHRELLSLNARYIYTFNYDNALEFYEDLIVTEKDTKEAKMLKKSIDDLSGRIKELTIKTSSSQGITSNNQAEYSESSHNTVPIMGFSQEDIKRLSAERAEKENELAKLKTSSSQKYYVVRNSKEIQRSGYQHCIFKLHGSLRNENEKYGFDEDNHLQYIICQEDYDSYTERHEAFVDLMRISLLREAFCIIGFSCDDPNFLLWMNWVKDINDRAHDNGTEPNPKYYINVDDYELPDDKTLMLKNHGIEIINLSEIYDGKGNKQSRKQRLLKFFDDLKKFKKSDNLWDNVNIKHRDSLNISNQDIEYDSDIVEREWKRRLLFPYPTITKKIDEYARDDIIRMLPQYIDKQPVNPLKLKLVLLALSDSNMPFSQLKIDEEHLTKLRQEINADTDLLQKYSDYEELTAIAQGNIADNPMEHASNDVRNYYTLILKSLISFDFDDASSKLEEWKPTTAYAKLVKMLLCCSFTKTEYSDADIKKLYDELMNNDDEQYVYTAYNLLLRTRPSNTWSSDPNHIYNVIFNSRRKLISRNPKLISWSDFIRSLHNEGFPEKKVESLGQIVTVVGFNDRRRKPSEQLIMMLVKGGLFPEINNQDLIDQEFWMKVVETVYRWYPQFCLLGTALYNEKDMLRRVAQLYTYTPDVSLRRKLPTILVNILRGTRSKIFTKDDMTLAQLRNSLFIFAQYFIKVVPYFSWLEIYKELFDENDWIIDNNEKPYFYKEDRNFAKNALGYITNEEYCNDIISRCLNYGHNITDYQNRLIIAAGKGLKSLNRQNLGTLEKWMKSKMTKIQSFVIFNLQNLLNQDCYQKWVQNLSVDLLQHDVTLEAVCSTVESPNEELRKSLSSSVAKSSGVWANGIMNQEENKIIIGTGPMLNIDEIDENFSLTDEAVIAIYNKLKLSFNQVKLHLKKNDFMSTVNHWDRLIRSMSNFLERHKKVLSNQDDYIGYRDEVESKFNELRDNRTIAERLVTTEDEDVQDAVIDLFQAVQTNGIKDYAFEYHMLANTILQKSTKALQTCLDHFSWIIGKYTDFFVQHGFIRVVKMILAMYSPYFTAEPCEEWTLEAEKDQIEKYMLRLCVWLEKQGEDIGAWKEYEQVILLVSTLAIMVSVQNRHLASPLHQCYRCAHIKN